jgi:hypothetical protein
MIPRPASIQAQPAREINTAHTKAAPEGLAIRNGRGTENPIAGYTACGPLWIRPGASALPSAVKSAAPRRPPQGRLCLSCFRAAPSPTRWLRGSHAVRQSAHAAIWRPQNFSSNRRCHERRGALHAAPPIAGTHIEQEFVESARDFVDNRYRSCGRRNRKRCSTKDLFGERGGTRTLDPMIKSHVLYHLSYALTRRGV